MEFEDILKQVGEYGRYQKRLVYFFLIPTTTIFSILCMNTFFMLSEPDHWCFVPQLANLSLDDQQLLSRPLLDPSSLTDVDEKPEGKILQDSCNYFDIDYDNEARRLVEFKRRFNSTKGFVRQADQFTPTKPCNRWTYDKSNYEANAVTWLNLVCEKKHLKSLIQTIHGIGEVVGNPFFGLLSDKFGRHTIFFAAMISALLSSASPIMFRGVVVFAVCRFLNSFTSASLYNLPYIVLTELVGPEHRTRLIGIGATCWTIGMCILPGVAYLSRDWIVLTIVPSLCVLPMFAYWNFLPESPRWLLSKGKYKRAYEVMANIARVNGKEVPPDLMQQLLDLNRQKEKTRRDSIISSGRRRSVVVKDSSVNNDFEVSQEGSFADIFRCPGLRKKFLILTFSWIANVCSYRGLTLNFENFHGNEFINWLLLSVVEFPSNLLCWALMETRLGRRWTNSIFMTLGGIALCVPLLIPDSAATAIIIASLAGKFLTNMAYNVVYQQTAELFPTPVRNQAMSYMTAIAAGANFALPYLASQGKAHVWIPLVVMGIISVVSGVANSFLPETLHENLPQTIEDGDSFGRKQKFFSLAKKKSHLSINHGNNLEKSRRLSSLEGKTSLDIDVVANNNANDGSTPAST